MVDLSFNAGAIKNVLHNTVAAITEDSVMDAESMASFNAHVLAMEQAIDVMQRADADSEVEQQMSAESIGRLEQKDINRIGSYALDLLENLAAFVQSKTGEESDDLLQLSLPLSLWVVRHGGKLSRIDMLVNTLAAYANETSEPRALAELSVVIKQIIDACDDEISSDLEQTNMMRPWRILNLNYGIVATRSHQPGIIEQAYDTLIKNIPRDARNFFREGMQQMDIIGYPDEVRQVVERYHKMWGAEGSLH